MRLAHIAPLLLAAGCATTSTSWLAKVNEEVITGKDLRLEFERSHKALGDILGDEAEVRKYVERLVDRRLFVQEGYRIGLHEAPEVRDAVDRFRAQKLVELFVREEVEAKSRPSDEEVRAVFESLPDPVEARQMVLSSREEAEAFRASLGKKGADFEKAVRERSIGPSAKHGGLGVFGWGAGEVYEKVLFTMKEGEVSPVLKTEAGWEVLRVEKRKPVTKPAFDKLEPQIRQILARRRRLALEAELYAALWAKQDAKVVDCPLEAAALREAAARKDATPCATWRGGAVTVEAIARRVKPEAVEAAGEKWPALRRMVAEDLLNRELLRAEAEERGLASRPEIADPVRIRQDEQVESTLYRDYVTKGIAVSDEDARRHYEASLDRYKEDVQLELAQILVDSAEKAKEVEEKVKSRQPFAELAAALSKDTRTADKGGRVGFVEKRALVDELAPIANLQEGEVSAPIQAKDGWHIVKVLSVKPERQRTFDEVKEEARQTLLQERKTAARDRWVKTLRDAATVKISKAGIRAYGKERAAAVRAEQAAKQAEAKAAAEKAAAAKAAAEAKEGATPAPPAPPASDAPPAPAGATPSAAPAAPAPVAP